MNRAGKSILWFLGACLVLTEAIAGLVLKSGNNISGLAVLTYALLCWTALEPNLGSVNNRCRVLSVNMKLTRRSLAAAGGALWGGAARRLAAQLAGSGSDTFPRVEGLTRQVAEFIANAKYASL